MDPIQPSSQPSSLQLSSLQPLSTDRNGLFESEAIAVESLLGSPRPNLPSRMQRLMTPLRRLVLRCIRVYWVQQLAVNRALLAAMRTLRRESRGETASHAAMLQQQSSAQERIVAEMARVREDLTELAADVRAPHERVGAVAPFTRPQTRAKAGPDGDRDPHREDGQPTDRERQDG